MTPLSNEKLAQVIELAEKLKLAAEHKPQIDTDKMALIHAQAVQHANDHDLARYVGKELGIESHYVDAALQTLHPSEEQILLAKKELGVKVGYGSEQEFKYLYGRELFERLRDVSNQIFPEQKHELKFDHSFILYTIQSHKVNGLFWKKTKHYEREIASLKWEFNRRLYVLEISDSRLLVICKKEIENFINKGSIYGVKIELIH